jgi:hypothetical protein
VKDGPDFICIGMQKAGTGWLYDHLAHHPDFWMPPLKEIHYLDRDVPMFGNARKFLKKLDRDGKQKDAELSRRRPMEERDMAFLGDIAALRGKPRDMANYAALFRHKNKQLSGDVTPGYSGMGEETIRDVAARFPDVRIVQLVRDPVARLWSQLSMAARRERFDPALLDDPKAFRVWLDEMSDPKSDSRSKVDIQKVAFPARVARRWERNAPGLRFRHFFFDDIVERPEELRSEILAWLDADPLKAAGPAADHNRKSNYEKLELTPPIEAVLVDFFRDELRACAERYGGHAAGWAARYGA